MSEKYLNDLVNNPSGLDKEIAIELEKKLFLARPENMNISASLLATGQAKRLLQQMAFNPIFMIVPTLRCDHSCTYCQVSRANISAHGYDLNEGKISEIVNTVYRLGKPPYKIEIQGGEPLVRFDLVERIYAELEAKIPNDKFEMVIATSLSLMSDDILNWARRKNVYFSVSLDGHEKTHNESRILPNNNSYSKAKEWALKIQEELGRTRIATVTTVTRSLLKNPKSVVEGHLELGLNDLFVRPISPYGFSRNNQSDLYSPEEYMEFYRSLISIIINENMNGRSIVEHSLAIHIKRMLRPNFSGYADLKSPGGVLLNAIVFDYDGKVYGSDEARMLQRTIPTNDFSLGDCSSPNIENNDLYAHILENSFNDFHPGCEDCAYQPYCGVDPMQSISTQGEPVGDKSILYFCAYHKSMFSLCSEILSGCGLEKEMIEGWADA